MSTKRQIQAEETRRRIFAAAQQLINEKGFDAFTMQDVAEAAGVGVTTGPSKSPENSSTSSARCS